MDLRYRYVGYGTRFLAKEGKREDGTCSADSLYENEIAVDVGGAQSTHVDADRIIVDHHTYGGREPFPSAAAGVLHCAQSVHAAFRDRQSPFWLVSHRQPDFDAYCAMYLARCILLGEIPYDGWEELGIQKARWGGPGKIDWFNPSLRGVTPERLWPVLLAAYASCVDHCRPLACPRERALHSVLYAARLRGRDYDNQASGAVEFFAEVQRAMTEQGLNPLYDSVLEHSERFLPELRLLEREMAAYRRDIRRSRRHAVYVQKAPADFAQWFAVLENTSLLDPQGQLIAAHVQGDGQGYELVDGVFLRDPESLLFKEWAREDTENSSLGRGFLFTAVADSEGCPLGEANRSRYFFALDPHRAGSLHLYNVWARLQQRELDVLAEPDHAEVREERRLEGRPPRSGFEGRAKGCYREFFHDPWFDGRNYDCTIVDTPNHGTLIKSGHAPDLSDDPVAQIVLDELQSAIFHSDVSICDYSMSGSRTSEVSQEQPVSTPAQRDTSREDDSYRFCRVELDESLEISTGVLPEQVGQVLWRHLHPDAGPSVPFEMGECHLIKSSKWLGVWSQRGVAIAYKPSVAAQIDDSQSLFARLVNLARGLDELNAAVSKRLVHRRASACQREEAQRSHNIGTQEALTDDSEVLALGEELIRLEAEAQHSLALPHNRLVARFFETSRLHDILRTLRDVYIAASERTQSITLNRNLDEMRELQSKLEWVEVFIVGVYAVEMAHLVGVSLRFGEEFVGWSLLCIATVVPALMVWLLRPDKHKGLRLRRLCFTALLIVILFALYIAAGIRNRKADMNSGGGPQHSSRGLPTLQVVGLPPQELDSLAALADCAKAANDDCARLGRLGHAHGVGDRPFCSKLEELCSPTSLASRLAEEDAFNLVACFWQGGTALVALPSVAPPGIVGHEPVPEPTVPQTYGHPPSVSIPAYSSTRNVMIPLRSPLGSVASQNALARVVAARRFRARVTSDRLRSR